MSVVRSVVRSVIRGIKGLPIFPAGEPLFSSESIRLESSDLTTLEAG